jgi:arsenate reductase (glutaredoxin)
MTTIYHNPRCSKSRAACDLVANVEANERVEIVEYLKQPLTVDQLKALHAMLGGPLLDMVRTGESEYSELGLDAPGITDDQVYEAIASHPILLQRPIVVRNGRAVIGRPTENIAALFE